MVLALGLSFTITASWISYEEVVMATEALAHRRDQRTADTLTLKIGGVLQNANLQTQFYPSLYIAYIGLFCVCFHQFIRDL